MPDRDPAAAPNAPFDQGVFLLHYNRGRESFHEGRYAEARKDLENAQRLRPDDPDVLNLLGLVYFKANAFPEAEVIYRRLVDENPNVFILHSNLGLILFKQGKLDDAEHFLMRSIDLRPNYAKSHLYLGLLFRQKKKFGMAIDHLKFAAADKLVRDVEAEMRAIVAPAAGAATRFATDKIKAFTPDDLSRAEQARTQPGYVSSAMPATRAAPPPPSAAAPVTTERGAAATPAVATPAAPAAIAPPAPQAARTPIDIAGHTAARKLQDAVDETPQGEEKRIDLGNRIEGASRTFALHANGFLEINFARSVHLKRGTVSSYSGNLKFVEESGLLGTTAQTLIKAAGQGKIFVYEKGRKTFLLDLNEEFIYVEGSNLLALEDSLTYRVEPIYDTSYQRKIDTVKIFGKGSLAISTSIEPLTLRVTKDYPLSISSNALVAWTGNLIPTVVDDKTLENIMISRADDAGFKIRFEGDGVVVSVS